MFPIQFILYFAVIWAYKCDPQDVQSCLAAFETDFRKCDAGDINCQCDRVLDKGATCFEDCPDEALDEFISTYADGVCRKAAALQLDIEPSFKIAQGTKVSQTSASINATKSIRSGQVLAKADNATGANISEPRTKPSNATELAPNRSQNAHERSRHANVTTSGSSGHDESPLNMMAVGLTATTGLAMLLILMFL